MNTIGLTSPHTKGEHVKKVQQALKKNWTRLDFLQGSVDGDFGPETSRACKRAKYWLGYPSKEIKRGGKAGSKLLKFLGLKSAKKLPVLYRLRRKKRLKKDDSKPLRVQAYHKLDRYMGTKESPANSNHVIFTKLWGLIGPWCAMCVSCALAWAKSRTFKIGRYEAYVPTILADAEAGRNGLSIVRWQHVNFGMLVCYDWDDDGVADHIGFFKHWIEHGKTFEAREGNTSPTNNSNGGELMMRERSINDVARYHGAPAFVNVTR